MTMIAALVALAFGAGAGIFLASRHFLKKRMPVWVAFFHGVGGATGFALVLYTVVREPNYRPIRDVLYLLIATVGLGVVNLLFHVRKVRHRTSLILMHGLTAVTAASMLIRAIVVHAEPAPVIEAPAPSASSARPASSVPPIASAAPAEPKPAASDAVASSPKNDELIPDAATKAALEQPVTFQRRSTELGPGSYDRIAVVANALKQHPEIALVQVQGHADERGDDIRNIVLTHSRALVVVNALVERGVSRRRLRAVGFGSRCPADSDCRRTNAPESCRGADAWERDRRVVFLVLQSGKTSFQGEVACPRGVELIPAAERRFHVPAK